MDEALFFIIFVANITEINQTRNIWRQKGWPYLTWNNKELSCVLGGIRSRQGSLAGKLSIISNEYKIKEHLSALVSEIIYSSKLENKVLNESTVKEALTRQLASPSFKGGEGFSYEERVVQATTDVILNWEEPISEERLLRWKSLFSPNSVEGEFATAEYRKIVKEPLLDLQLSHLYNHDSSLMPSEVRRFLKWMNTIHPTDPIIKAGVAQLRFLLIHPFNEDNGQMARLLSSFFIVRADGFPERLYSISEQIYKEKETYQSVLKRVLNGGFDITEWLLWFMYTLEKGLVEAEKRLQIVLERLKFWERNRLVSLNERQVKMINLLWEGMEGRLTSSIWANINLCSPDTALRDIQDLIDKKILYKNESGGRSTSYDLN